VEAMGAKAIAIQTNFQHPLRLKNFQDDGAKIRWSPNGMCPSIEIVSRFKKNRGLGAK